MPTVQLDLTITPIPVKSESEIRALTFQAPAFPGPAGIRLPIPSGADVLAILAHATRRDLLLVEIEGPGGEGHPLGGTTILIEAADLADYFLPTLRSMMGDERRPTAQRLSQLGRDHGGTISQSTILETMVTGRWPSRSDPILETAALIPALVRAAEAAVARGESLLLRYETVSGGIAREPRSMSWWAAQKRPFIMANIGALLLIGASWLGGGAPIDALVRLWPDLFRYYLAFIVAFLLPLWLVLAIVYAQMRRAGRVYFVRPGTQELVPTHLCHFVLQLHRTRFYLVTLYQAAAQPGRTWTPPAGIYLAIFAAGLLGFCLLTSAGGTLPPLLLFSILIFWLSALILGLGQLRAR